VNKNFQQQTIVRLMVSLSRTRSTIFGLAFSVFVATLAGCIPIKTVKSDVRDFPREVRSSVKRGDTRQKVHSVLGTPIVSAPGSSVEVYRRSGRDVEIGFPVIPLPVPTPGEKVIGFVLVAYDRNHVITDLAVDTWTEYKNFRLTAGGYSFVNYHSSEPGTLLGPYIPAEQLVKVPIPVGKCRLVLLMGRCVMDRVLLDGDEIADLSPLGSFCSITVTEPRAGTFVPKDISPGKHRLDVKQQERHSEFSTVFDCSGGWIVSAELFVKPVEHTWWGHRLEGEISIVTGPQRIMDLEDLRPILWHDGRWFGPAQRRMSE